MSLRERKKVKTREAIQRHALRLFMAQGYAETTVDQIAAAAEVSPATFFRYFPSKEETVLYDPIDPIAFDLLRGLPAELSPIAAMRVAVRQVFEQLSAPEWQHEQDRQLLVLTVPELRSALFDKFAEGIDQLSAVIAEREGKQPDDFAVRTLVGAVIGAMMSVLITELERGGLHRLAEPVDAALALLEDGLPL